ncbi:MAG TPA: helix-turn-helix transcriptional regulator [Chloroflexota bacterium]
MSTDWQRSRCRERLLGLADSSLGSVELRLEAMALLKRSLGFERWCWTIGDPESLLAGGDLAEADLWPVMPRSFTLEQRGDVNAAHVLARGGRSVAGLSSATNGDLALSRCWDECLRPHGIGDQATVVLRDGYGSWGYLKAWRDRDDPSFAAEELALLEAVAPALGSALRRRAIGPGPPRIPGNASERGSGVLILDADMHPRSWTTEAQAWLDALPGADFARRYGSLPQVVYAVAARAAAAESPSVVGLPARMRVRTTAGHWASIEAAPLHGSTDDGLIAVTLRSATREEVLNLVCRAYALTAREREIMGLVFAGASTRTMAERLCISVNTCQDHLKAIFDKAGVRSRRELAAVQAG